MSPVAAGGGAQHFLTVYDDSNQSEFDTGLLPAAAACMNKKWRRSWKTPATNHFTCSVFVQINIADNKDCIEHI